MEYYTDPIKYYRLFPLFFHPSGFDAKALFLKISYTCAKQGGTDLEASILLMNSDSAGRH